MAYVYPAGDVGDRYLVTFNGLLFNQTVLNTFWYGVSQQVNGAAKNTVMDALKTKLVSLNHLRDKFLACVGSQYTLVNIWIQPIDPIRYVKKVYTDGSTGSNGEDCTTANLAGVIVRRGVRSARNAVSTLHVPIASTGGAVSSGLLSVGMKASMDSLALVVAEQVNTGTGYVFDPIIRHGVGGANFDVIQNAFTDPEARTMRRRTVGLGI